MVSALERLIVHRVPVSPKTTWLFLELVLGDGSHGWGEVTDFANEAAVLAEVAAIETVLRGERIADLAGCLMRIESRQVSQARRVVRSGLEQAWLDVRARAAGVTFASHLGGCYRHRVPVYANINRGIADTRSPLDFAAQARLAIADGYRAIKIAPFDGVNWQDGASRDGRALRDKGLERIFAVRDAIGDGVDLMIDCHGRLDPATAAVLLDAVSGARPFWMEDMLGSPFGADDHRAIRRRAHRYGIRIAGGEEIADLGEFLAFLAADGADVVLPDLRLTGVRSGMVMCEIAAAKGRYVSLHNPVGPVLDAVSRQVAATLADFLVLERPVRESPLWEELRNGAVDLDEGAAALEAEPGLGLDLDPQHLQHTAAPAASARVVSFKSMPGAGPDA
ncbi:enolase C-terminal domain-like protein [Devosia nitrariae]|uniref:enolase C-terminal domain-like protein n=1 Tax=Devosia nitrariae TaxID=2071872 RepID=UPI0024E118E0|nr:enolase C-terminal domain-like protein [Devosia nitrariae]